MRTTVTLADDATAAVEETMRRRQIGRSEAVNELIRAGLARRGDATGYTHQTHPMGTRVDVSNVGEVLDLLDQWDDRSDPEARVVG